ncbi:glycosyltransferase [Phenylobacterium sp. VNQ135]
MDTDIVSRLFDPAWYRSQAKLDTSVDALAHFRLAGAKRKYSPHPLFHPEFYVWQAAELGPVGDCPFTHYLTEGWRAGLSPHPMLSVPWLRQQHPTLQDAEPIQFLMDTGLEKVAFSPLFVPGPYRAARPHLASSDGADFARHFITVGWRDGLPTHPLFSPDAYVLQAPAAATYEFGVAAHYVQDGWRSGTPISPAFDRHWYLRQQPAAASLDAALHYINIGWRLGASPNPLFDVSWYEHQIGGAPGNESHLEHYLSKGWRDHKSPHPLFDLHWYVAAAKTTGAVHPYLHFLAVGDAMRHSAHPLFNPTLYLAWYPDVAASGVPPHRHYAAAGHREMRRPHPMFDPEHYAWHSPNPAEAVRGGLLHYLRAQPSERRHPHPLFDGEALRAQSTRAMAGVDPLVDYVQSRMAPRSKTISAAAWKGRVKTRRSSAQDPSKSRPRPGHQPLVSVLLPVYSSPQPHLARAIESVRAQTYPAWELVIVDDGSPKMDTFRFCEGEARRDPRLKVIRNKKNGGISAATNTALNAATGEFVAMLDHDDVLKPEALELLVGKLLDEEADAAYSDQAYITDAGGWDGEFHKPDWSPTFLYGVMYVGHLLIVRRELALRVGGFDSKFDRVQDFEFMLRVSEHTSRIAHLPEIIYYWRRTPGSIAHDASAKGVIEPLQAAAVNGHFARTGFPGEAHPHERLPHRLRIVPKVDTNAAPPVLIVMGGQPDEATLARSRTLLKRSGTAARLKVLHGSGQAAISELEEIVARTTEQTLVYWDASARPSSPQFVRYLEMHLSREDVACAALHSSTREGLVVQAGGMTSESGLHAAMKGFHIRADGHAGSLACDREVRAVLGPILGVRLDRLREIGPLDRDLGSPVSALVDISIRAQGLGLRNVNIAGCVAVVAANSSALPAVDQILLAQKHAAVFSLPDPYALPMYDTERATKLSV